MKGLRRSGFTMIELVIVIVIMGVMAFTAYKALMGSSDKSKIGSGLIKDEVGQVRLNATDAREGSKLNDFRDMHGDRAYSSLFPSNYEGMYVENGVAKNGLNGYGFADSTGGKLMEFSTSASLITASDQCLIEDTVTSGGALSTNTTVNAEDGIFAFRSQAMPDCNIFTANQSSFSSTLRHNQSYAVIIDCSKSQSVQVKKVMEAKAKAWFMKNYQGMTKTDAGTVMTNAVGMDANGTMVYISSPDDATWGNATDGIFGARLLVQ